MRKSICIGIVALGLLGACKPKEPVTTKTQEIPATSEDLLNGTWELNYISGPRIAFDGLYPDRKPEMTFDVATKTVSGYTGCNSFNGPLNVTGNKIDFSKPMAMTKKMCMGEGEPVFLKTLSQINAYSFSDGNKTLHFLQGDVALMRFSKK